ncbi:MAG: AAA family ATPase, partial [Alphaproteobacteria bacterium]|nr:AAA family ATPase [Alphaproteobacteria bacterium]
ALDSATVAVNAFAGTGKTATLVALAQARPHQRLLYIAFNKAIQLEAARRFPANTVAKTCHALAFRHTGARYRHKLVSKLRPLEVIEWLGLGHYPLAEAYSRAYDVLETVQRFLASTSPEPTAAMAPALTRASDGDWLAAQARTLWALMSDPDSPVGMVHDGYLKQFQLSQPQLSEFDLVLFDEAQDANPAMLDIVARQPLPQVFVGDRHQQIYSWRGACNALDAIQPTATRFLTHSFRFGSPIAQLANVLLATYKDETVPVVGRRAGGCLGRVQRQHPYTVIARTNAGVFDEAAQRVQDPASPRLHFVGGLAGYPFQRILDAWRLYAERRDEVRDPLLLHFPDFPTMERLAAEVSDLELKQLCRVVRHYGHRIPSLVRQIEHSAVTDPATASVCLSTAHKVKGLEFDQVRLAEDFPSLVRTPPQERDPEEVNLLY